jgi:hypothetical protein
VELITDRYIRTCLLDGHVTLPSAGVSMLVSESLIGYPPPPVPKTPPNRVAPQVSM